MVMVVTGGDGTESGGGDGNDDGGSTGRGGRGGVWMWSLQWSLELEVVAIVFVVASYYSFFFFSSLQWYENILLSMIIQKDKSQVSETPVVFHSISNVKGVLVSQKPQTNEHTEWDKKSHITKEITLLNYLIKK